MSQTPQVPQVGQVQNGYQWNGSAWVPLAQAQQVPPVGYVQDGYRWDGAQWVALAQAQQMPQVGQVENGYRWDGAQWVPVAQAQQMPQVGQVENGYRWDGSAWVVAEQAAAESQSSSSESEAEAAELEAEEAVFDSESPAFQTESAGAESAGAESVEPASAEPDVSVSTPENSQAAVLAEFNRLAAAWQLQLNQHGDKLTLERVLAERKVFLSTARLEYVAKVTIDDQHQEIKFSEMLKESGSGVTASDSDVSTGFGFQKSSYSSSGGIAEAIDEQAAKFGAQYSYDFPYEALRGQVSQLAQAFGYSFKYNLW